MNLTIKGQLVYVGQIKHVSQTFKVLEIRVKTDGEYPQVYTIQITNDKADKFNLLEGSFISVECDLRGKEQGERCYLNLNAWKWNEESAF